MKILAFETTDRQGSLAALEGSDLLAEIPLAAGQRSAQSFAPALVQLWKTVGWKPSDVQLVAVASGPGSFTGLRVGVTAAKTLSYAVGCPLVAVDALEAIARQTAVAGDLDAGNWPVGLWAVIDAQRQQLFAARFEIAEQGALPTFQQPTQIMDISAWLDELRPGEIVSGPGLEKIQERLPAGIVLADRSVWRPRAATVGLLAHRDFLAGRRDDPFQLSPRYLRKSAAEEQRGW